VNQRSVAVITGASSGIGEATALALARRGYAVVLGARRVEKLEDVARRCTQAGGEGVAQAADVADATQVEALVDLAVRRFGRLDVMVNNAGFGQFARVVEIADRDLQDLFAVNVFGVFYGCRAAARVMMAQRSGHIFNVSSVLGKRGSPFHAAYSASKFALVGLGDSLRVEMMPYHVRVTTVCPALTQTEFFEHSRRGQQARSSFVRFKGMTPVSVVAEKIARTVGRNKPELVFTLGGKVLALLAALSPRLTDRMMKVYHDDLAKRLRSP
jgi:short-subunit dehydrogenase